jgi:hypothetical protein
MDNPVSTLLQAAVDKGVISAEQRAAMQALATDLDATSPRRPELARGFNVVTVAYALGAVLVVFACGWFLADRWIQLGPWGVLGVALGYAAIAAVAMRWLARHDFPEAAGISAMVMVAITPLAIWAAESASGWWPEFGWGGAAPVDNPAYAGRWIVAELATIVAGLVIVRRTRYVAATIPVAAAFYALGMHVAQHFVPVGAPVFQRWSMLADALLLCATADAVDRLQRRRAGGGQGDMAFAFWVVGLAGLLVSILSFWPTAGVLRHALPLVALSLIGASLVLGRRTHLVAGGLLIFLYLAYLAGEVFRDTALFPLVLMALGLVLIAATVWMQRRFPTLVERFGARRRAGRAGLPGPAALPWLPVLAALGVALLRASAVDPNPQRDDERRLQGVPPRSDSAALVPPGSTAPMGRGPGG